MFKLIQGDCLEKMKDIPDGSVDAVICDPPYGTTACKWDAVIPFAPMWEQLKRVIKPNGAIVLTASQPFTSMLVMSNLKMFKYEWVWEKDSAGNFANQKYHPAKYHENVCVFYHNNCTYNPIKIMRSDASLKRHKTGSNCVIKSGNAQNKIHHYNIVEKTHRISTDGTKNPSSIIYFPKYDIPRYTGIKHPTRKPVALMEYLIKTYTNEGETVLDFTMGSGTTGVACVRTNRSFIGIELDPGYFAIAEKRIRDEGGLFNVQTPVVQ